MDILTLALAKKYTEETVLGGGAIKGKNCTIQSEVPIEGGTRVTFAWELDDGTKVDAGVVPSGYVKSISKAEIAALFEVD